MARIGWAVMMRQADCRNRRHDQPGPDLGEPGPTDQTFSFAQNPRTIAAEAALDGIYVIRSTGRPNTAMPPRDKPVG